MALHVISQEWGEPDAVAGAIVKVKSVLLKNMQQQLQRKALAAAAGPQLSSLWKQQQHQLQ